MPVSWSSYLARHPPAGKGCFGSVKTPAHPPIGGRAGGRTGGPNDRIVRCGDETSSEDWNVSGRRPGGTRRTEMNTGHPATREPFRAIRRLLLGYLGIGVAALVVVILLRNHPAEVNGAARG